MDNSEEKIDLAKLTHRELLIQVYNTVQNLEMVTTEQTKRLNTNDIQMAILKTKIQTWSALIGFGCGIVGSLIVAYLTKS